MSATSSGMSSTVAAATESKLLKRDTMLNDLEDLDPGTLNKVNDFVDDDLLSCFLWAAGENAVAQPGWERAARSTLSALLAEEVCKFLRSDVLLGDALRAQPAWGLPRGGRGGCDGGILGVWREEEEEPLLGSGG